MDNNYGAEIHNEWKQAGQNQSQSAQLQSLNQEMTATVNDYKKKVAQFYDHVLSEEQLLQITTQTEWYQLYLNRQRLQARNTQAHFEKVYYTRYPKPENERFPFFTYQHEGTNRTCTLSDIIAYRKVWVRGQQLLHAEEPTGFQGFYNLTESKALQRNMVSSFYIKDVRNLKKNYYAASLYTTPFIWFAVGLSNYNKLIREGHESYIFLGVILGGFVLMLLVIWFINSRRDAARHNATVKKMHKLDADFSEEYLIGNLMNKLACIHYADNFDQVRPFFTSNVKKLRENYTDVVDCKLDNYSFLSYQSDSDYEYMKVSVVLRVQHDTEIGWREKVERLNLRLVRKKPSTMHIIHDVADYRCNSCGASLSLMNGGRCTACGGGLNLIDQDWVIDKYVVKSDK